jgi:DNA-binding transcriptional regulator LsrR (DeoR family)
MQGKSAQRAEMLADVAEMYYLKNMNQSEIAGQLGLERSTVSRLLSEARQQHIVEIHIHRPLSFNSQLEEQITHRFGLLRTCVLAERDPGTGAALERLGATGAALVKEYLETEITLGISWGTAVSAVVSALDEDPSEPVAPPGLKIVQLVGALGTQNSHYDGHWLVQRLAARLGAEAYYLNAPFMVDSPAMVHSLLETSNIHQVIELGKNASLAILGIGSTDPQYSSFYRAGYVPYADLEALLKAGMVGDVCGRHFDIHGNSSNLDFDRRLVTIDREDLQHIPLRIGIAGGQGKAQAVVGALRAGFINILVTDDTLAGILLARKF